jgi:hypothetical protein
MPVNPEQNYSVSASVFEALEWKGEGRRRNNKRYMPARPRQYATITEPRQVVETAFGVYEGELPEADTQLENLTALQKLLRANIGRVMLLKSGGWEDPAQQETRLFSPLPNEDGNVLEFTVETATHKAGGFRGWSTKMEMPAISDVYDIWYQDTEVRPTTIGYPLYKTRRVRGSMALRTEVIRPIEKIQVITDPDEIRKITLTEHPHFGEELLEMMDDVIVELNRSPQPADA